MKRLAAALLLLLPMLFGFAGAMQAQAAKPDEATAAPDESHAKPDETHPKSDETKVKLDSTASSLTHIEAELAKKNQSGGDLQALRAQIDPISDWLEDFIQKFAPRLNGLKARLDQFGPVPTDKAKATAEAAATTEGRKAAQKAYADAEAIFHRAQLLEDQASRLQRIIGARRRAVFTHALFERAPSLLSPSLWSQVIGEWPGNLSSMHYLFVDTYAAGAGRITRLEALTLVALLALVLLSYLPARIVARRFLVRDRAATDVPRLRRVLVAIRIAVATAVVPIAAVGALVATCRAFDLLDPRIQPVVSALFGGVARASLAIGVARAVFAPNRPAWRLIDINDEIARRLRNMIVAVVILNAVFKFIEALNDGVAATLTTAVATRAVGTLLVAFVALAALARIERVKSKAQPATEDVAAEVERHWWGLVNILAWLVVITVIVAVVSGYVAFAAFVVDQIIGIAAIAAVLYVLTVLADDGIAAAFAPTALPGRAILAGVGMRREALGQISVLASGTLRVLFSIVALLLVLAPWGFQSDDLTTYLRSTLLGFSLGGLSIAPTSIAIAVALFGIVIMLSRAVRGWLERKYLPQTHLGAGLQNSILTSLGYVGFILAAMLSLSYVGFSFEKFAIIAGALSVGIGFGLQSVVSNFVSGLIVLWERAIQVGDWIVIGDIEGYVRRINVRSTEIQTMDKATMIVPNSNLVTGSVKNWLKNDRIARIKLTIGVDLNANPEQVREILLSCAQAHEHIVAIPAPGALLTGLADSTLSFDLYAHVDDAERSGGVKSDLYFAILREFRSAGIAMPSPQHEVRVRDAVRVEGLRGSLSATAE